MISDTPIAPSIPDVPTVSALIGCGCEGHHHCPCFYLRYKLQGVSSMNEAEKANKVMKCMLSKVRPTQNCSLFSPASQAFWVSVTLPMLIFFSPGYFLHPTSSALPGPTPRVVELKHHLLYEAFLA